MKTHSITILICTIVVMMILNEKCVQGADDNRFEQESVYANRFLKRTFFHPGSTKCEEQKREAREDYEERCEPSFPLFRNTGTRRFCPDIHNWKELDNYEIGDGYESRDPISGIFIHKKTMATIKIFLFLSLLLISVVDSRAIRHRRQIAPRQTGQDVSNYVSNGFNTIRDTVAPAIGYTTDRLSQFWDRYKQNVNQGVNQIGQTWDQYKQGINQGINQMGQTWDQYKQGFNQGWNQFSQNSYPQYPPNYDNRNYGYNQYPNSMNNNYNNQPYMNPNYGGRNGPSNANTPYNTGNQWYQNYGPQQRSNGYYQPNQPINTYQRPFAQRR